MNENTLKQRLAGRLSTRQIQLMSMITLPITEMEQRIKEELEINPALEEGAAPTTESDTMEEHQGEISAEEMQMGDYSSSDEVPDATLRRYERSNAPSPADIPFAESESLTEMLRGQLPLTALTPQQTRVAEFLIGSLDDDGLLRRDPQSLLDDLAIYYSLYITPDELEEVEEVLRTLDPPGVAARSLQQCLSIQLHRRTDFSKALALARRVIDEGFDLFAARQFDKLLTRLQQPPNDQETLREAIAIIKKLNPTPGLDYTSRLDDTLSVVVPDFIVRNQDGELTVSLNRANIPEVHLSDSFAERMGAYNVDLRTVTDSETRDTARFVKQKLEEARNFIEMIEVRNRTLLATMTAIVAKQRDYFLSGDLAQLKPMILKDIADTIGFDVSTISRVTSTKYVQTDFGLFPLKYFFSAITTTQDGDEVSTHRVRSLIAQLIADEDKSAPLSDDAIAERLADEGFNVARRTVAKYRDQLGIAVARLRRNL